MDLHKRLIQSVTDKASRDAAIDFMRRTYSDPAMRVGWEGVVVEAQRKQGWHELNWEDALRLYDVEGRPVGVTYPQKGGGHAWVWTGKWSYAPALAPKASIEGAPYSPGMFLHEFPNVDLLALEALARGALGSEIDNQQPLLSPPASEIPDRQLVADTYELTKFLMSRRPAGFIELAPHVMGSLGLELPWALPLLESCYNCAREELGEPIGTDRQPEVRGASREVAASANEKKPFDLDPMDEFLWTLRKAVTEYALEKSRVLARSVRYHLRRAPPTGIVELRGHANLWDEYCVEVQEGPSPLESAWALAVEPIIDLVVEKLPQREATLLTFAQRWEEDDFDNLDPEEVRADEIRKPVLRALAELAMEKDLDWVTW